MLLYHHMTQALSTTLADDNRLWNPVFRFRLLIIPADVNGPPLVGTKVLKIRPKHLFEYLLTEVRISTQTRRTNAESTPRAGYQSSSTSPRYLLRGYPGSKATKVAQNWRRHPIQYYILVVCNIVLGKVQYQGLTRLFLRRSV